jgi:hypothetical protein
MSYPLFSGGFDVSILLGLSVTQISDQRFVSRLLFYLGTSCDCNIRVKILICLLLTTQRPAGTDDDGDNGHGQVRR